MTLSFIRQSKRLGLFLAALLTASVASASDYTAALDINIDCNKHGAVVTVKDGPTYYLGKECDAILQNVGEGRWWFAASAFVIEIDGRTLQFADDLDCDLPKCAAVDNASRKVNPA